MIEDFRQYVSIAKVLGKRSMEGDAYKGLGFVYAVLGNFKEAINCHNQQLSIAIELGDRAAEGAAYDNLGNTYQRMGDFKQAIKCHNQRLSIVKELGDQAGEGAAYGNIGDAYQSLGDFNQAIKYHNQRLSIAKALGNRTGEGTAYGNLGNAYQSLGDFKQAIEYHNQLLTIAKELGDRAGEGTAYGNLGNAFQSLGDFKQAIVYQKQSLSIAKEVGNRHGEGAAYNNLGNSYHSLGDFRQAIEYHNQRACIAKELGQREKEAIAYGNLGNDYQSLGDFKQAIEYQKQGLNIAKEVGNRAGEGASYSNLGNAYQSLGDFKQAIKYHNQHLSVAKELGDKAGEGGAYGNLGNGYQSLGDFEQAIDYHNQCLSISKELGQRDRVGIVYCNLGIAYKSLGNLEKAIEYHNQDLSIAKELGNRAGEAAAYGNLGNTYQSLGDFKRAIEYHNQDLNIVKELGDRAGEGASYSNLGNVYGSLGDSKRAIEYHNRHLNIAKELGDRVGEGRVCYALGIDFEISDSLYEALDCYRSSVKLYNEVRALLNSEDAWKISFRNAFQHAYTALWRTLVRLQRTNEALCVAEQGRAQALKDLIKFKYESDLLPSGSFELELTISGILSDTTTQTVFLALESRNILLWVLCKGGNVHFRQKEVADDDAVAFLESARKHFFDENQINARISCENRSLEEERKESPPSKEFVQETVATLKCQNNSLYLFYDCVIGPIADLLESDELIIVPEGPLCLIPYAACVDNAARYLSETTRIRILPSLTSLKLITDCPEDYHNKTGALLVGDPCVETVRRKRKLVTILRLPRADKEVEVIGKILDTKPLTGRDATKDEVLKRMGSVALVHIAAHGDMEAGEIALAPNPDRTSTIPKDKDYLLTMSDVQAVQLRARLVVLSCCHSAQGKVTAEGVVGIGRAFLGAGARSVLVALWAIDDESTMEFMKSFYKHLASRCCASLALHRAMKCLRESKKFCAAKYWAPFVLIGDDVTIEFAKIP